jgi:hypothetical protein
VGVETTITTVKAVVIVVMLIAAQRGACVIAVARNATA